MHIIETKKGKIEMKLPNYPQSMRLVRELGLSSGKEFDWYEMLAYIAENSKQYIHSISIEGISDYDQLLESPIYAEEVNLIVTAVTKQIEEFSTGKKND